MKRTTAIFYLAWMIFLLSTGVATAESLSPADSLRQAAAPLQGREQFSALLKVAISTNKLADWDTLLNKSFILGDTQAISQAKLNRLLCLANNYPADSVMTQAPATLSFLLDAKQYTYYFNAYNVYINSLFRNRKYKDAEQQAIRMFEVAKSVDNPVGMAMALMVQGTVFYKLSLYDKALVVLDEGLRLCPSYEEGNNQTMYAYGNLCIWGFMAAEKKDDAKMMAEYATLFNNLVDWREATDKNDPSGHYPVAARALRARVLLKENKTNEARQLLNEAEHFIRPHIQGNAYEQFYEARFQLHYSKKEYDKALADIDILLEAHKEFPAFYLNDLLKKAELLSLTGQPQKGITLYHKYIQEKDSINRVEIAERLDELQTIYEVDRLRLERHNSRLWLFTTAGGCLLLIFLLAGYMIYSHRLQTKNRILYQRIRRQEHRDNLMVEAIRQIPEKDLSAELQLFMRLNELLEKEKLYTNPSLTREDLARQLGTNHTYLMEAVRNCTENLSIREYLNQIRLRYASQLLTATPRLPIDNIWQDAGFSSRSGFYDTFRSKYGMSPGEYRNLSEEERKKHA